jgi:hypothetical protein
LGVKSFWWRIPVLVLLVVIASCSGKGTSDSKQENTAGAQESDASVIADSSGVPTA